MAFGISRKTVDTAGGAITSGSSSVYINGSAAARHGDTVASHGLSPHNTATLVSTSRSVFINGIRVVASNNVATCGHAASGSANVLVGA